MNKGLLEKFSGAAAAYSVRLLNRQYTGALMKIRRVDSVTSQDNGEIFVFPDSTGWVSLNSKVVDPSHASAATTLGEFVQAPGFAQPDKATIITTSNTQHAYVVVWKDQSGNSNDASQGITTAQPQIVSAGALVVENGKPAIDMIDTSDFFNANLSLTQPCTIVGVNKAEYTGTFSLISRGGIPGIWYGYLNNGNYGVYAGTWLTASGSASQRLDAFVIDGSSTELYQNSSLLTSGNAGTANSTGNDIGSDNASQNFTGTIQELIFYNSDQSPNRIDIEEDINTAFNIYNNAPSPKKNSFLGKYPGAAAAYSTRNLTGKSKQPILKVRRELGTDTDTEETIYSSNNQLDTNQLLNFVNGVSEDPRLPLDISEGYGYSLRLVKSGYQGPLVEVRESSGNTTKDFYADSTGRINEQALLDFCGSNDGHISKWYNQSGVDRHLTSDAAANEPKIVESGVVVKDTLGNIAIKFTNAGNEFLAIQDATVFDLQEQTIAMHFMSTAIPASGSKRIIGISQSAGETFDASTRNNVSISTTGDIILTSQSSSVTLNTIPQSVNSPSILTINFKGSDSSGTSNKTTQSTTLPTTSVKGLSVGARFTTTATPDFITSEVIQYTSAQIGDNKNEVEASFNKQYKIYGDAYVSTWYDQSTAASDNLLLDDNPDAAAAYSLRKLRALYQGSAINVRRDSDNATKDIGFTSSGELDVNELINFCSGSNGFVTTWYNQAFTSKNELLLDTTEGSGAAAAYSVRQLSSTATECMVIRRSSDGKTRTIGFKDTHIDEAAIESFCSGTTCTVQTWKDQSGNNNDATQSTPANQPTIYTGGAIVKESGRVAVDFNKANSEHFEFTSADFAGDYIDLFLTGLIDTYSANGTMLLGSTTVSGTWWQVGGGSNYFVQGNNQGTAIAVNDSTRYLFNQFSSVSAVNMSLSGVDFSDSASVSTIPSGARTYLLGKYPTGTNWNYDGKMQEFVAYPSQRTTGNRTSIESNINNYYGIFSTNNAEQDVALSQPKIYDSSTGIVTENGKPAIEGDGTNGKHLTTSNTTLSGDLAVITVCSFDTSNLDSMIFGGTFAATKGYLWRQTATTLNWKNDSENGFNNFTVSLLAANNLIFGNRAGTDVSMAVNGSNSTVTENATQGLSFTVNRIGGALGDQYSLDGTYQEMVFYNSDQSSRRLNIEGNINNHYRIYSLNDATQATALNQPQLVSNGRVILENGKPAVFFEADIMNFTLPAMTEGEVFRVLKAANDPSLNASEAGGDVLGTGWNSGANSHYPWTNGNIYDSTGRNSQLSFNPTANLAQQHLLNILSKSGEWTARINGAQEYTTSSNTVGFRTSNSFGQTGTNLLKHHYQEFVIWPSDQSNNRTNIENNINSAFGIYWDGTKTGLLDNQPNAAAAYSVRALSSSYTGPLIEIRDANGNTRNIYATYNGDLDEAAIEAFCSGSTCTVSKWYDQSGNANDASQADALSQPTIYTSGAVVKENNKPAVQFDGAGDKLATSTSLTLYNLITVCTSEETSYNYGNFISFQNGNNYSGLGVGNSNTQIFGYGDGADTGADIDIYQDTNFFNSGNTTFANTENQHLYFLITNGQKTAGGMAMGHRYSGGFGTLDCLIQEVVLYPSDQSSNRTNIERNINQYFNIYTDPGVDRLLNKYPGAAAAYSLRKLNSQYTGPAVRVRRDSDNVHADVYFDLNATISKYSRVGVLSSSTDPIAAASTTTLQTFMGSNNGFVAVWYDQASSNDASQGTAINQPKIYDSSTGVVMENGKPAIQTDGSDDTMALTSTINFTDLTWFTVTKKADTDSNGSVIFFGGNTNAYAGDDVDNRGNPSLQAPSASIIRNTLGNTSASGGEINQHLNYYNRNGTNASGGLNGEVNTEATVATTTFGLTELFQYGSNYNFEGLVQELVLYDSNKKSDRSGIESNINTFYSIYAKPKKLLDQYGGAAAAYSLRSLQSNYTGPLVTIRRDSDGIEVDVYADLNGEFSLNSIVKNVAETTTGATQGTFNPGTPFVTLSQFVQGSPNCYVVEWKDQSGNGNHAAQVTAANQPKIYDSVTGVVTEGSAGNEKPALNLDGNDYFVTSVTSTASDYTMHAVTKNSRTDSYLFDSQTGRLILEARGTGRGVYYDGTWRGTSHTGTGHQLQSIYAVAPSSGQSYVNGTQINTGVAYTQKAIGGTTALGGGYGIGNQILGTMQEFILYASDQSSNRTNIESNINTFYSIY